MQRVHQSETTNDIELRETKATSPDPIHHQQDSFIPVLPSISDWRRYWKRGVLMAGLLLLSFILGYRMNTSPPILQPVQTTYIGNDPTPDELQKNFMAFCPATDQEVNNYTARNNKNNDLRRVIDTKQSKYSVRLEKNQGSDYLKNRTYIISAKSRQDKNLRYCGRARRLNETCSQSLPDLCLAKPMFDVLFKQAIDIIWVNAFDPKYSPGNSDCMGSSDPRCSLHLRLLNMTFSDPTVVNQTKMISSIDMMPIDSSNWPMSTHVHGAQIRPTFDGNPLSWISNNKTRKYGLGAFSIKDDWYYDKFEQSTEEKYKFLPPKFTLHDSIGSEQFNFKVNRYPNIQNPGTLWFHDHSMRLTSYNVGGGLSGFYLLRDPDVEDKMKELQAQQRFVMLDGSTVSTLTDLSASTVYRFRFLNGNFENGNTIKYSFHYGSCEPAGPIVNFTVIGADSSLFNQSLDDQQSFALSNGERVELLIVFSENFTNVSICSQSASRSKFSNEHSSFHRKREASRANRIYSINNIRLHHKTSLKFNDSSIKNLAFPSVAYVNLTDPVFQQSVAVKRMRPLLLTNNFLTIHGRANFHSGHSENPKIGEVEDWFLINTISYIQHPIHVHLINFQVVRQYNLRMFDSGHSLYALDFYAAAIKYAYQNRTDNDTDVTRLYEAVFASGKVNYTILNNNYANIQSMENLTYALASIYPENLVDENKVSGLDVMKICTQEDEDNLKPYDISCKGSSLYITNPEGQPHSRSFYSRWKDTAYVESLKVFQYRIRWAKSDYRQERDGNKYFNVPSDQLREYPGFVYHCHILSHEDNEMMRPIMLQLPNGVVPNSTCNQVQWNPKAACINNQTNKH